MEDIKESMFQMQQLFKQQMDNFQAQLQKTSSPASLAADFDSFREFMLKALQTLQNQVQVLTRGQENLEMYNRRKILLVHGLPEQDGEATVNVVVKTIIDHMKMADFSTSCVSRCHRLGRAASPDSPRPILVKFRDMSQRSKIWQSKSILKGTGITLSEFLIKSRHDVFMAARKKFGVTKSWTRDGSVFVLGADDKRHRVTSLVDLDKISGPPSAVESEHLTALSVAPKDLEATTQKITRRGGKKKPNE